MTKKRELIISQIEDRRGLRRRRLFRLAPAGRAELRRWCSQPISNAEIVSEGMTPNAVGMIEASAKYNPS